MRLALMADWSHRSPQRGIYSSVYLLPTCLQVQDTPETQFFATCAPIWALCRKLLSSQNSDPDHKREEVDQQKMVLCAPESKGGRETPEDEPDAEPVILRMVFDAEQEEERSPLGAQGSDQGSGICHL